MKRECRRDGKGRLRQRKKRKAKTVEKKAKTKGKGKWRLKLDVILKGIVRRLRGDGRERGRCTTRGKERCEGKKD